MSLNKILMLNPAKSAMLEVYNFIYFPISFWPFRKKREKAQSSPKDMTLRGNDKLSLAQYGEFKMSCTCR